MSKELNDIKAKLNLKDPTIEKAKEVYAEVVTKDLLVGKKFALNT